MTYRLVQGSDEGINLSLREVLSVVGVLGVRHLQERLSQRVYVLLLQRKSHLGASVLNKREGS
jgi:hypothetical protein